MSNENIEFETQGPWSLRAELDCLLIEEKNRLDENANMLAEMLEANSRLKDDPSYQYLLGKHMGRLETVSGIEAFMHTTSETELPEVALQALVGYLKPNDMENDSDGEAS